MRNNFAQRSSEISDIVMFCTTFMMAAEDNYSEVSGARRCPHFNYALKLSGEFIFFGH